MWTSEREAALRKRVLEIPISRTLGFVFEEFGEGFCRMRVPFDRGYEGVFQSLHGGILMTAADSAACFAILTRVDPDTVLTTTDMNIRFLAPCLTAATIEARVIKLGKTLCPVAVDLFDDSRKLVAVAQVAYIRLDRMPRR